MLFLEDLRNVLGPGHRCYPENLGQVHRGHSQEFGKGREVVTHSDGENGMLLNQPSEGWGQEVEPLVKVLRQLL